MHGSVGYHGVMQVLEEPFVTRSAIVNVLRPGHAGGESPFRTLRRARCASGGLRVDVRTRTGRLVGSTHLYSTLNADAARAMRLQEQPLARTLAARAAELERSPDAQVIFDTVRSIAGQMSADPYDESSPIELQRYARLRGRSAWPGIDRAALTREWLVHSVAWLGRDELGELTKAVNALAKAAAEARTDVIGDAFPPVSTFYGVVRRMDSSAAEVEGDDGTRLVPRADLERQGLAVLGQAVALLCEVLPGGGTLVSPMPAVRLESETELLPDPLTEIEELEPDGMLGLLLGGEDQAWLDRMLAREPTAVPLAPIRSA